MKTILNLSLITVILLTGCVSQKKKDQAINISGAFALYPLVVQWSEAYQSQHPDIRFNISGGGAGKGMADALAGAVDLGMFSRAIAPEEINQGVWWVGLTIDAVVPTISDQNPYLPEIKSEGFIQDEFRAVFIEGTATDWSNILSIPNEKDIVVYTRLDACGAAGTWAEYLGGTQEDLKGIGIYGDPGLAEAVARDPGGIAFNNTIYVYDNKTGQKRPGMEVIPIDINGNGTIDPEEDFYDSFESVLQAIAAEVYPYPPARELYFVSKGKPQKPAVLDFIQWVLTEGQKYVGEAGYVTISQSKIDNYLEKLN